MNIRKDLYFGLVALRGQALGANYERFCRDIREGISSDLTKKALIKLLTHCKQSVPYYAEIMKSRGDSFMEDPEEYLRSFPILTKNILRRNFEALKSSDLAKRKWYFNTSGGSTGEPARFIQDHDYAAISGALKLLYSRLCANKELGESEIEFWSSPRDLERSKNSWIAQLLNKLNNIEILSVCHLSPEVMYRYIRILNEKKPKLIIAYASVMFQMARFVEQNKVYVTPQKAIITSAATLYPYMRETIERAFQCKVFDRYGSREVGDIACERPGSEGLWVAPWGNYLEIIDSDGNRVVDGRSGEILVTSLTNYAMPLIRYKIGDRGMLSRRDKHNCQILAGVLGRSTEVFINSKGMLIESGFFMPSLYFRDWIAQYQVIQKSPACVLFKIVKTESEIPAGELHELARKTKLIMDDDQCDVRFEFVDEIPVTESGKFRFLLSEINAG